MALPAGSRVGPYEILGLIGAGGMREVHRARDTRLGRDVAIKSLPREFADDPSRLSRFEREAKLLASLSHPNIAGIYRLEESDGARYRVLELVEGESLAAKLARGALPLNKVVEVGKQIAAGVEAAHESGVTHRDLKPGNVMVDLGHTLHLMGRDSAAERYVRESVERLRVVRGADHPNTLVGIGTLGEILLDLGRPDEAESLFEETLAGQEKVHGPDSPEARLTRELLARARAGVGR